MILQESCGNDAFVDSRETKNDSVPKKRSQEKNEVKDMNFEIKGKDFYRDGKQIKIISGAVHYFRNMPDTWGDIFKKMRACGCNTVETYCAWNMHEKHPDEFDFTGNLDIAGFIKAAEKEGLMVIVRPGPYICAEWEFGGLPWWIQTDENMEIRSRHIVNTMELVTCGIIVQNILK